LKSSPELSHQVPEVTALTGVRGVAALYVVFYHYFSPIELRSRPLSLLGHGYLAVDLFFILSGFIMTLNYARFFATGVRSSNFRRFLVRRLARVYPLYLLALLIATALVAAGQLSFLGRSLIRDFIANLLMIQNWGNWHSIETPAWSISTEWSAYLIFPFLIARIDGTSRRWIGILLTSSFAALWWLTFYSHQHLDPLKLLDQPYGLTSILRCLSEFVLGMLAFKFQSGSYGRFSRWLDSLSFILLAVIVTLLCFPKTDLAVVLTFPLLIVVLCAGNSIIGRILGSSLLELLGVLSFAVYLLHYLLVPLLNGLDSHFRAEGFSHAHTHAVAIVFPILMLSSAFIYYRFEVPARKTIRLLLGD
jgi:peptidoglycan/LPS O-acetylase OafA/YrhL